MQRAHRLASEQRVDHRVNYIRCRIGKAKVASEVHCFQLSRRSHHYHLLRAALVSSPQLLVPAQAALAFEQYLPLLMHRYQK